MGLVRTWTGQLVRAAGASLIAPVALLLVSAVVASGGGLGSFGSLGEVASGPSVPDIGLAQTPGSALENAEIVGAQLTPPADVSQPPAPASDALASAASAPAGTAGGPAATSPQAPTRRRSRDSPEASVPITKPEAGSPAPIAPPSSPASPPPPAPVEDLLDATRNLGDTLREPLAPLTNAILKLLRGPPRQ